MYKVLGGVDVADMQQYVKDGWCEMRKKRNAVWTERNREIH